jgi:hypothetical protein
MRKMRIPKFMQRLHFQYRRVFQSRRLRSTSVTCGDERGKGDFCRMRGGFSEAGTPLFHRAPKSLKDLLYSLSIMRRCSPMRRLKEEKAWRKAQGGGVNAFSRYENNKTKPPLALVKLLKVLDRHPELLAEIRSA